MQVDFFELRQRTNDFNALRRLLVSTTSERRNRSGFKGESVRCPSVASPRCQKKFLKIRAGLSHFRQSDVRHLRASNVQEMQLPSCGQIFRSRILNLSRVEYELLDLWPIAELCEDSRVHSRIHQTEKPKSS